MRKFIMHTFIVSLWLLYHYGYYITVVILLRKNENYLARYIPLFETKSQWELNSQDTVTELLRDNR